MTSYDFDWTPRTRLVCGWGSLERLGTIARELGGRRVLVVTDAGLVAAGHVARAEAILARAGLAVVRFAGVHENPTTDDVEACVLRAREAAIDLIVGLGGGSSLDTAKGCNFLLTGGGRMHDYQGYGKARAPMLPMIAVPTTAGTGSECQSYALIADAATHQKMACGDPGAAPRVALLDPELTLSQPPRVTACTGVDALAHAIESAVTRRRTPLSDAFATRAFVLIAGALRRVLLTPDDRDARARMQLGAALAGMAIEASMLGAAHSLANPLTAHYGIVHGQAVGMALPAVIRFNAALPEVARIYRDLLLAAGLPAPADGAEGEALARWVEETLALAGFPRSLAECGVEKAAVPRLAAEAAAQWTAQFNPRPLSEGDFVALYRAALAGRDAVAGPPAVAPR